MEGVLGSLYTLPEGFDGTVTCLGYVEPFYSDFDGSVVLTGVKNPASLIYVYAFFIDNIATAFAACALYEVFPISTTAIFSLSTLVWLISYDLLVTAFCLSITWAAFSYWARVRAQNVGNARRALKREHFCKLLAFSSTVVMATAHKSITLYGWQGVELAAHGDRRCCLRPLLWIRNGRRTAFPAAEETRRHTAHGHTTTV